MGKKKVCMFYYDLSALLCEQKLDDTASEEVKIKITYFFLTNYLKTSTVIFLLAMKLLPMVKWSIVWAISTLDKIMCV